MFYWIFYTDMYDRLNWKYASKNDLNYNTKIKNKRFQSVKYEEKEIKLELED
jgi:hypothetical protein